jgi:DeoR family transcriptional regulator, fructose operon transcriptional repressor
MSINTEQRRQSILAEVYAKGRVSVKGIAARRDVSEATARRDLQALVATGQLEHVHGGAAAPRVSDFSFQSKSYRNMEAKTTIGRLAAELVSEGDQVFMDSGTTTLQLAMHVKQRQDLTVITSSVRLAEEFAVSAGSRVIMLGGQYRPDRHDTVGALAMRTLETLHNYLAFIGADGLSMDIGLTANDIESANLHALAVANARETVLLADHTKFLRSSLSRIVDFNAVSRIVTDQPPPPEWMAFLDGKGIDVIWPGDIAQVVGD